MSFLDYILTLLAMVLVLEGLLYALFTDQMRRLIAQALIMPQADLKRAGIAMTAVGFILIWLLQII